MKSVLFLAVMLLLTFRVVAEGNLVPVKGTKVRMIQPEGFEESDQITGFMQKSTTASIMVSEIPAPYAAVKAPLNEADLTSKGMKVISHREITLAGRPAIFLEMVQTEQGHEFLKWMVLTGDESQAVMITATCLVRFRDALAAPLEKAVLSAVWDAADQLDPSENLPFTYEEQPEFKVAARIGNMLMLTPDGVKPEKGDAKPLMVIAPSISNVDIPDLKAFSLERIKQTSQVTEPAVVDVKEASQNGIRYCAIFAKTTWKNNPEVPLTLCQGIVLEGRTYYMVQCFVPAAEDRMYANVFMKLVSSLRKK